MDGGMGKQQRGRDDDQGNQLQGSTSQSGITGKKQIMMGNSDAEESER